MLLFSIFIKFDPQYRQLSPSLIIDLPQFVQILNCDFNELIPKKTIPINNMGVKNNKKYSEDAGSETIEIEAEEIN